MEYVVAGVTSLVEYGQRYQFHLWNGVLLLGFSCWDKSCSSSTAFTGVSIKYAAWP